MFSLELIWCLYNFLVLECNTNSSRPSLRVRMGTNLISQSVILHPTMYDLRAQISPWGHLDWVIGSSNERCGIAWTSYIKELTLNVRSCSYSKLSIWQTKYLLETICTPEIDLNPEVNFNWSKGDSIHIWFNRSDAPPPSQINLDPNFNQTN